MAMDGYSSEGGRITDSEEQFLPELSPIPINQYTNMDYLADFWGPVSNFGIPVAAVMDTQKSPELYVTFFFLRSLNESYTIPRTRLIPDIHEI